jgi:hypothetical protein
MVEVELAEDGSTRQLMGLKAEQVAAAAQRRDPQSERPTDPLPRRLGEEQGNDEPTRPISTPGHGMPGPHLQGEADHPVARTPKGAPKLAFRPDAPQEPSADAPVETLPTVNLDPQTVRLSDRDPRQRAATGEGFETKRVDPPRLRPQAPLGRRPTRGPLAPSGQRQPAAPATPQSAARDGRPSQSPWDRPTERAEVHQQGMEGRAWSAQVIQRALVAQGYDPTEESSDQIRALGDSTDQLAIPPELAQADVASHDEPTPTPEPVPFGAQPPALMSPAEGMPPMRGPSAGQSAAPPPRQPGPGEAPLIGAGGPAAGATPSWQPASPRPAPPAPSAQAVPPSPPTSAPPGPPAAPASAPSSAAARPAPDYAPTYDYQAVPSKKRARVSPILLIVLLMALGIGIGAFWYLYGRAQHKGEGGGEPTAGEGVAASPRPTHGGAWRRLAASRSEQYGLDPIDLDPPVAVSAEVVSTDSPARLRLACRVVNESGRPIVSLGLLARWHEVHDTVGVFSADQATFRPAISDEQPLAPGAVAEAVVDLQADYTPPGPWRESFVWIWVTVTGESDLFYRGAVEMVDVPAPE